jgi:membrane protein implicated in regulation of membrane protease activity
MITCPYCGTNYTSFQTNCANCGASLPLPAEKPAEAPEERISIPPPAPRQVPRNYAWRLLFSEGWGITGFVFALIGTIFTVLGFALTAAIVTAFVGIPLAVLGIIFVAGGAALLVWRYGEAQKTAEVVRQGQAVLGRINAVQQSYHVRINGRYPWIITYRYVVNGQEHPGKVTTLSQPDLSQRPGKEVYVLYWPDEPGRSTIYPTPYGYFEP